MSMFDVTPIEVSITQSLRYRIRISDRVRMLGIGIVYVSKEPWELKGAPVLRKISRFLRGKWKS